MLEMESSPGAGEGKTEVGASAAHMMSKADDIFLCLFALGASSEPYTGNDSGRLVHRLESPSLQTQAASTWKLPLVTVPSAYMPSHFSHV